MADGFDLAAIADLSRQQTLGAINPTKHHEALLRRIIGSVIEHYAEGRVEIIDGYLSAARLGMPEPVQIVIQQLRIDVALRQGEAIKKLNMWAEAVGGWHGKKWQARVLAGLDIDVTPLTRAETIRPALDRAMRDGADLIKDVSEDTARRIEKAALESFESGEGAAGFAKQMRDQMGISRRRADLISRDQLGKLTGNLDRLRHTEAGLSKYEWITAGDERVRASHEERDGEVFKWSDPPDDGHPGEPVACRCRARAVIPGMNRKGKTPR